jgi:tetratricopeptide (TPR) repeat protein
MFRYTSLLVNAGRIDDAILLTETGLRFDRDNLTIKNWVEQLRGMRQGPAPFAAVQQRLTQLEAQYRANPTNAKTVFDLASLYLQAQRTNAAFGLFDQLLTQPNVDLNSVLSIANAYAQLQHGPRLEATLRKLVTLTPGSPEAWYDLAATQAILKRPNDSLQSLTRAVELSNQRLGADPAQRDLRKDAATNRSFAHLQALPEFQKLVAPQ